MEGRCELLTGTLAVLINNVFWRLIVIFQNRDVRSGLIPPRGGWDELHTERKPHLQDYLTNGVFGDLIAFSLIDFAVVAAVFRGGVKKWMLFCFPVGTAAAIAFYKMATRPVRASMAIDWWFSPSFSEDRMEIQVTTAGKLHLVYFGMQSAVAFIGAVLFLLRRMSFREAVVGLTGALLYGVAFILDKRQGHI